MFSPIGETNTEVATFSPEKAKQTRKYCTRCTCPGFPYCFSRVYPLRILDTTHMKKRIAAGERICGKCGCTTCKYEKLDKWSSCKYCRQWYLSDLHCRYVYLTLLSNTINCFPSGVTVFGFRIKFLTKVIVFVREFISTREQPMMNVEYVKQEFFLIENVNHVMQKNTSHFAP